MLVISAIGILFLFSAFTTYTPYYMQPAEASSYSTKNLSNNAGFSSDPQIAVSGNNVYVAWQDFTPGNWDIFFRASNDNGATFGNTINLSNNAVDVAGLGIDKPYDSRYNGMVSATVTVVPELPSSILVVMALVAATAIAITRSKRFLIDTAKGSPEA